MQKNKPPQLAAMLLRRIFSRGEDNTQVGDFEEMFYEISQEKGVRRAKCWYWTQLLLSLKSFITGTIYWRAIMFSNYVKIAIRNIQKHKGYSFINIAGLAIGMACCILILLWVQDELSFDSFHQNADELYQVVTEANYTDSSIRFRGTPAPLGPALEDELPEILKMARYASVGEILVKYEDKRFYEGGLGFIDPAFLEMFTFPLVKGDLQAVLDDHSSVVITEEMAEKYFGEEDPVGKDLILANQIDAKVTGVLKDIPDNSHLQFDFLMPYQLYVSLGAPTHWGGHSYLTYVLLQKGTLAQKINETLPEWTTAHTGEPVRYYLQPVTDIHLHDLDGGGFITYVYIFSAIALFVLLVACINFMNLSTARSGNRSLEVGLRKVVGAPRTELIKQFLSESISLSIIAFIIALLLVWIFLPYFNNLAAKQLSMNLLTNLPVAAGFILLALFTGLLSGSYPAFFLSSFKPIKVLRGALKSGASGSLTRKVLVVFQFAMSVILIISTLIVYKQYKFMKNTSLGFDKEQIVYMPIRGEIGNKFESLKTDLLQNSQISHVTAASGLPNVAWNGEWGQINWEGKNPDQTLRMNHIAVDDNYIETFNMEIVYGRDFSRKFSTDTSNFILNEAAIAAMGIEEPIGKQFYLLFRTGTIVGVVKDFHYASLRNTIDPLILRMVPARFWRFVIVKIQPGSHDLTEVMNYIENKYNAHEPAYPFEFTFMDDRIDTQYRTEQRTGTILICFSILTIFVACLGLFGLVSFMAEKRTKEIGIRKVLGASTPTVVTLLIKEFVKWVLIANIIAWPVAYFLMKKMLLDNYSYRITIGVDILIIAGMFSIIISLLTVSYQALKAARTNPVDSLKYE